MTTRVRKASAEERAEYLKHGPVYPLYGFVNCDGVPCVVEDLRGSWSPPNPTFEVLAPTDYHFTDKLHSRVCYGLKDVVHEADGEGLEPCECESH